MSPTAIVSVPFGPPDGAAAVLAAGAAAGLAAGAGAAAAGAEVAGAAAAGAAAAGAEAAGAEAAGAAAASEELQAIPATISAAAATPTTNLLSNQLGHISDPPSMESVL